MVIKDEFILNVMKSDAWFKEHHKRKGSIPSEANVKVGLLFRGVQKLGDEPNWTEHGIPPCK